MGQLRSQPKWLNAVLLRLFGSADEAQRVRIYWQSLSESRFPVHGRVWLRICWITLRFEWSLWSHLARLELRVEPDDGEVVLGVALPPVSLWWAVEGVGPLFKAKSREIGWSFQGWSLVWHGWTDPYEMRGGMPWWRYFTVNMPDVLFGRAVYRAVELESEMLAVPMPEGPYAGRAVLEECTWKRPRLPFTRRRRFVRIVTVHGIPDGRDKYDGVRESTHEASSIDAGLANFLIWVLGRRRVNEYTADPVICEACRAAAAVLALGGDREAGTP